MTPPSAAATAPAVGPAHPRTRPRPLRAPRRVSGPTRPLAPSRTRTRGPSVRPERGLLRGSLAAVEALAQHRLLDRLIRGRSWIGLVAFALIGIVTLQLGLLKLNGGIGRALEREAKLQTENAAISIENSEMTSATRVESQASAQGMAFEPNGTLHFLAARAGQDVGKAVAALSASLRSSSGEGSEAASASHGQSASGEGTTPSGGEAATAGSSEHGSSGGEAASAGSSEHGSSGGESETPSREASNGEAAASSEASGGEAHAGESSSGEAEASSASTSSAAGGPGG